MKVPLSWLREYVDLPPSVSDLAERLTLAGLEVSAVRCLGFDPPTDLKVKSAERGPVWEPDKIVIGKVLEVKQHQNADKLKLVYIDYGRDTPQMVVTGAQNIAVGDAGQTVVLARLGASFFDGHAEEKVIKQLKPGVLRGVPSEGMVCSAYELGLSDDKEGGIILLNEEIKPGTPAVEVFGDIVLELEVTPNLARALSMIGVAREVAAIYGKSVKLPLLDIPVGTPASPVEAEIRIEDPSLSARYSAAVIHTVKHGAAPGWMQRRLNAAGMRPISNLVDITNYVMLEWGQPLHAFDYDILRKRAGGRPLLITVRPARAGETLVTLDKARRELSPDNLVIADEAGPIALAGVMGGLETEVTEKTTSVLLESANFHFLSVRKTARALDLPSEASTRFSKGVHPDLVPLASRRAVRLLIDHAGGTSDGRMADVYPVPLPPAVIDLDLDHVRRFLGMDFTAADVTRILAALEFTVEPLDGRRLRVTSPPNRLDIQDGVADLIEDLVRLHGYDRLPATLLAQELPEQNQNRPLQTEERVRDLLVGCGLTEIITYSLTDPGKEATLGSETETPPYVELKNPISQERRVMRRSVLASGLEVLKKNLEHTPDVRLFEIGLVYLPRAGERLPAEQPRLCVLMTGYRQPAFWGESTAARAVIDFYDLKGVIEALFAGLHVTGVSYRPAAVPYLHPARAASAVIAGESVGVFGQLHPTAAGKFGLGKAVVLAADFDLAALIKAVPERFTAAPIPRFPAALRDVSVLVSQGVPSEAVSAEILAAGGELLSGTRLFDLYAGTGIPDGHKSLTYALSYQAPDRTLTDKEIDKAHKKIEDRLKQAFKAQIRGQEKV